MRAFVDTNILVRHLTGDPPELAERATAFLASDTELLVPDLIIAETVYVLESFYDTPRPQIATAMRSLVAHPRVITVDPAVLLRTIEVYETARIDFADAYLVASAESTNIHTIASLDRTLDRVTTIQRIEPPPQ